MLKTEKKRKELDMFPQFQWENTAQIEEKWKQWKLIPMVDDG